MKRFWGLIINIVKKFDARDFHLYCGTALLAVGLGSVWWQAGLITSGLIFLFVAFRRVKIGNINKH